MINHFIYPIVLLSSLLMTTNTLAQSRDTQEAVDFLKNIEFEELAEIEVSLDDTFDIFEGLVKMKKASIASGIQQPVEMAPSVTTVITAQDIEATGASTLEEILQMVPGLHIGRLSNNAPLYIIRGISSAQNAEVLVMINGVALKSALHGNRSLYDYSPSIQHIARIEVIRGPGSAIYGADAFSGVINIITKDSDINGTEAGLRFGSFDTQHAWVLHGSKIADIDITAAIQYESTSGPGRILERDFQTSIDEQLAAVVPGYQPSSLAPGEFSTGLSEWDAYLDLRYDLWQLQLNYHAIMDRESGALFTVLDPLGRQNPWHLGVDLKWRNPTLTPNWDVAVSLSYKNLGENSTFWDFPPGTLQPGPCNTSGFCFFPDGMYQEATAKEQQNRFEVIGIYQGFNDHTLRLSTGYTLEDLYEVTIFANYGLDREGNFILPSRGLVDLSDTPSAFYAEAARTNWHVVLQDTWQILPDWQLTVGVRHDSYSDFGDTTNPRAALSWRINNQLTSRLVYGNAFRSPSFSEQFTQRPGSIVGNPNLSPEKNSSFDLAFDYRPSDNLYLALNLFNYEVKDKILLFSRNGQQLPFYYGNLGIWTGKGIEFETRLKMNSRSSLLFNYSYANIKRNVADISESIEVITTPYPQHHMYLRTDWLLYPDWYLDTQLNWVGGVKQQLSVASKARDYATLDLVLRYKQSNKKPWNIAFGIRNLFDVDVRTSSNASLTLSNYPQAGQNFFLEVRHQFK